MKILLALSHSIEEAEMLDLFHGLGYEVASLGGYIDPAHPHDTKRPALPHIPCHAAVKDAVDAIGAHDNLAAAQAHIPHEILEWLGDDGVIQYHHYLDARLFPQWDRLADWMDGGSGRRIIWRTVGQSVENNERLAAPYRDAGLEIVRYSPKERAIPGYAGEDALIRFWKDPDEWSGWNGEDATVINVTQQLAARDPYTNYRFWQAVTDGLPRRPLGPGSDTIGGAGELSYEEMKRHLRLGRCYLYCGTQPASYTLGLLEALITGIPVVSIGPGWMDAFEYGPQLFEGHELAPAAADDPAMARAMVEALLDDWDLAARVGAAQRERAIAEFSRETAAAAWRDFLGAP